MEQDQGQECEFPFFERYIAHSWIAQQASLHSGIVMSEMLKSRLTSRYTIGFKKAM
jgi:hypothetical protein